MDDFVYNANISAGRANRMMCTIEDDKIFSYDYSGKTQIGYTTQAYQELSEITQEYYNKLVDEGIIEIPKTAEELMQETLNETKQALAESQMINQEMLKLIQQMQNNNGTGGTINELQSTNNNVTDNKDVSKQRGRNKSSDKSSDTSNTGS